MGVVLGWLVKVVYPEDCGNSPKALFLRDWAIAVAKGDEREVLARFAPGATWEVVGASVDTAKDLAAVLRMLGRAGAAKLEIHSVLTHGKLGAVEATVQLADGSVARFCDVVEFRGAKGDAIARVTTYAATVSEGAARH